MLKEYIHNTAKTLLAPNKDGIKPLNISYTEINNTIQADAMECLRALVKAGELKYEGMNINKTPLFSLPDK